MGMIELKRKLQKVQRMQRKSLSKHLLEPWVSKEFINRHKENTVVELALKRVRNSIQIVVEGLYQEGHEEEEEYTKEVNRSLYYMVANKTFLIALCYKINVCLGFPN